MKVTHKIPLALIYKLTAEEADAADKQYRGSTIILKLIKDTLKRQLSSLLVEDEVLSGESSPSITSQLTRNLGRRYELRKLIRLLP